MTWLGVGNVEGVLIRADTRATPAAESVLLRGGVVGYQLPALQASVVPVSRGDLLILATDGIRKEPVVVEGPDGDDSIAIHHVGALVLAWDHRAFDGAYAASFLNEVRTVLETRDWDAELA